LQGAAAGLSFIYYFNRPLCPHPQKPTDAGGDPNLSASYTVPDRISSIFQPK
jgi:hypothetical protein